MVHKLVSMIGIAVVAVTIGVAGMTAATPTPAEAAFNTPGGSFADACAFMHWYDSATGRSNVWSGSQWASADWDSPACDGLISPYQ